MDSFIEVEVNAIEESLIQNWDPLNFHEWHTLKHKWREVCIQEEMYWKQKLRMHWLEEGDANTKFFHAMARSRIAAASVESIANEEGIILTGPEEIHEGPIEFFKGLLPSGQHASHGDKLDLVPSLVSHGDNEKLKRPFTLDETHAALVSIPLDCTLGLDRFTAVFFSKFWELTKGEVHAAMNELLGLNSFSLYITHTAIVLIPKRRALESLGDFQPISFSYNLQNFCQAYWEMSLNHPP